MHRGSAPTGLHESSLEISGMNFQADHLLLSDPPIETPTMRKVVYSNNWPKNKNSVYNAFQKSVNYNSQELVFGTREQL